MLQKNIKKKRSLHSAPSLREGPWMNCCHCHWCGKWCSMRLQDWDWWRWLVTGTINLTECLSVSSCKAVCWASMQSATWHSLWSVGLTTGWCDTTWDDVSRPLFLFVALGKPLLLRANEFLLPGVLIQFPPRKICICALRKTPMYICCTSIAAQENIACCR